MLINSVKKKKQLIQRIQVFDKSLLNDMSNALEHCKTTNQTCKYFNASQIHTVLILTEKVEKQKSKTTK